MFITKNELKTINLTEAFKDANFIKITDGRHTIFNSNGKIKITTHDGLTALPANKIPKYIKEKL